MNLLAGFDKKLSIPVLYPDSKDLCVKKLIFSRLIIRRIPKWESCCFYILLLSVIYYFCSSVEPGGSMGQCRFPMIW